jgi:hypothetical protein
MTPRVGFPSGMDMDPFALDPGTAERLVTGAVDAGDAPPAYRAVASTLQALRAAPESAEWTGEPAAVEQIAAAVVVVRRVRPTRRARRSRSRRVRFAAATALAGVLCVTGGFASAGSLPPPAQVAASTVLATVGISVPAGDHDPAVIDAPPTPASDPSAPPTTGPGQPSPARPDPTLGGPPAAPANPAAPGNSHSADPGAPAQDTPPSTANDHAKEHSPNGSPPADPGNGKNR